MEFWVVAGAWHAFPPRRCGAVPAPSCAEGPRTPTYDRLPAPPGWRHATCAEDLSRGARAAGAVSTGPGDLGHGERDARGVGEDGGAPGRALERRDHRRAAA